MKIITLKNSSMDSAQHAGKRFRTEVEARDAIREGLYASLYEVRDRTPQEVKTERNRRQQAKRASPEAKAKEAQASRRSYWKKNMGFGNLNDNHDPNLCSVCTKLKAQHDL